MLNVKTSLNRVSSVVLDPKNSLRLIGWVACFAALFSAIAALGNSPEWVVAVGSVLAVILGPIALCITTTRH